MIQKFGEIKDHNLLHVWSSIILSAGNAARSSSNQARIVEVIRSLGGAPAAWSGYCFVCCTSFCSSPHHLSSPLSLHSAPRNSLGPDRDASSASRRSELFAAKGRASAYKPSGPCFEKAVKTVPLVTTCRFLCFGTPTIRPTNQLLFNLMSAVYFWGRQFSSECLSQSRIYQPSNF